MAESHDWLCSTSFHIVWQSELVRRDGSFVALCNGAAQVWPNIQLDMIADCLCHLLWLLLGL